MTVDTSVLLYVFDEAAPAKRDAARQVVSALARLGGPLGLQSVGELQNALRRKLRRPVWEAAQQARNLLATFPSFAPTRDAAFRALADQAAGHGQYWDRLLIYSAGAAGCTAIVTEDAQGAGRLGGVEIVTAFAADGSLSQGARLALEL